MLETRAEKTSYLANCKYLLATTQGCANCGRGRLVDGFERYWDFDYDQYDSRRFVFKYTDKRGSDVPVAKLPRIKNSTTKSIDEALSRCVILCRSCADPRRTRKEITQCRLPVITILPGDS